MGGRGRVCEEAFACSPDALHLSSSIMAIVEDVV